MFEPLDAFDNDPAIVPPPITLINPPDRFSRSILDSIPAAIASLKPDEVAATVVNIRRDGDHTSIEAVLVIKAKNGWEVALDVESDFTTHGTSAGIWIAKRWKRD